MKRRRRQKGQGLLEGTLTLLGLLLLITSVMDLGQSFMFLQYFTERARAGARYAAVNTYDPQAVANFVVYNNPNGPAQGEAPLLGLKPQNIVVKRLDEGTPADRIEVSIRDYQMHFCTPLLAGLYKSRPFRSVIPVESLGAAN